MMVMYSIKKKEDSVKQELFCISRGIIDTERKSVNHEVKRRKGKTGEERKGIGEERKGTGKEKKQRHGKNSSSW